MSMHPKWRDLNGICMKRRVLDLHHKKKSMKEDREVS